MSNTVKRNEIYEGIVTDLTSSGAGVVKVGEYPLFVQGALRGERVKVKVTKTLKRYGFAKLEEIQTASSERQDAPCAVYDECGGCQLQHLTYEGQLEEKRQLVQNTLQKIGRFSTIDVPPVLGMEHPWRYRNKSQVPLQYVNGRPAWGFFKQRTHDIVPTETCLIQTEEANRLLEAITNALPKLHIPLYDEKKHRGVLRHVIVRKGMNTGQVMVVLITNGKKLPAKDRLIELILETEPNVTSIIQNINNQKTNVIFGNESHTLYGEPYIYDTIGDVKFQISDRSFYQINAGQMEVLYKEALDAAQLTGNETVIDAYCGIGTISLFLAQRAKHVYGVEIVKQAIEDARINARLNEMDNATFEVGKAEEVVPRWYEEGIEADVFVVDPPRKGCDATLLETIITHAPKTVVYVSCNPATFARDARILVDGGYQLEKVQPVDMFGHTMHIEVVAVLSRIEDEK